MFFLVNHHKIKLFYVFFAVVLLLGQTAFLFRENWKKAEASIGLVATPTDSTIELSWGNNATPSSIVYKIYRHGSMNMDCSQADANQIYDTSAIINSTNYSWSSDLANGVTYYFQACAFIVNGNTHVFYDRSNIISVVFNTPGQVSELHFVNPIRIEFNVGEVINFEVFGQNVSGVYARYRKKDTTLSSIISGSQVTVNGNNYTFNLNTSNLIAGDYEIFVMGIGVGGTLIQDDFFFKVNPMPNLGDTDQATAASTTIETTASTTAETTINKDTVENIVSSISLSGSNQDVFWNTNGVSENGFRIMWSKNSGVVYPLRNTSSDQSELIVNSDSNNFTLTAFAGTGNYYVKVCQNLLPYCGVYSNEIKVSLVDDSLIEQAEEIRINNFEIKNVGAKQYALKLQTNVKPDFVLFQRIDTQNEISHQRVDDLTYTASFNASGLNNGVYYFKAIVKNATNENSQVRYIEIANIVVATSTQEITPSVIAATSSIVNMETKATTVIEPQVNVKMEITDRSILGIKDFYFTTSGPINEIGVYLLIDGTKKEIGKAVYAGNGTWKYRFDSSKFRNGIYQMGGTGKTISGMVKESNQQIIEIKNLSIEITNPEIVTENKINIPSVNLSTSIAPSSFSATTSMTNQNFSTSIAETGEEFELKIKCNELGIESMDECQMYFENTPEICINAKIVDKKECQEKIYHETMPEICRQKGALTYSECSWIIMIENMPEECQAKGVVTVEECNNILNEIAAYQAKKDENVEKYLNETKETKKYLHDDCKYLDISSVEECREYLQNKSISNECLANKIFNQEECDQYIFNKIGSSECAKNGIYEKEECESYILNKIIENVKCENNDNKYVCQRTIKEKHLGKIVDIQVKYDELKKAVDIKTNNIISLGDLRNKLEKAKNILPLTSGEIKVILMNSREEIEINAKEELIQTSPIILILDDDGDGLSNDIEIAIGTDPKNQDTDSDGYLDGSEYRNGYNPLGSGKLNQDNLAPVQKAILENKELEQPKLRGAVNEAFVISNEIINNTQENGGVYNTFQGKAAPNSVISLYFYSDLPLIVTVKTDEFGNWKYELKESLSDGSHEVYVALNDNSGKIVAKGSPLNFLVKEARATTYGDVVKNYPLQTIEEEEKEIFIYYIFASISLIALGILAFLFIINRRKNIKEV